jgi:glucose-1-phosphate adenylyltransferase
VWLGDGASIEDSLVANGCRIEGRVTRSIVFPGVRVGPGAVVSESVIMADTHVSTGARVEHAILDKYVRVGTGAHVGADPAGPVENLDWLAGLTLVGKDTWIPEGGVVRRPSSIGVGGRYEDLPGGVLEAGSLVPNRHWYQELR